MATTPASVKLVYSDQITLGDLSNLFLDELFQRASATQVSWIYYHASRHRLKRVCGYFGRDTLISAIGKQQLLEAVLHFAGRPACEQRPYQRRPPGEPISTSTAKDLIRQIKTLFSWAADHDDLEWERPRSFSRLFRLKADRLKTIDDHAREARELVSGDVAVFSVADLARLYRLATSRERLFILLGLNCGFTSIDIATLRTFEVFLDGERPHIHKRRSKTGVEARWTLWPETAALLRKHQAKRNGELRWLLTDAYRPLVEVTATHRRDSIDQHWKLLFDRASPMEWMGFRFMRKTGANAVKRLGGLEESEMYLAHQEPGLNRHYANRNWDRMWNCLDRFRKELPFLGPAWALEPDECLFTFDAGIPWGDIEPPHSQRVTKRSELGRLNVSFHKGKRRYYVRVYRNGKTHWDGLFLTEEQAENAAKALRLRLDGIHPTTEPRRPAPPRVSLSIR